MSTPGWTPDHHGLVTPVTPFEHPTPSTQIQYILETHVSEAMFSPQQASHISETAYSSHQMAAYSSHQQSLTQGKTTRHGTHYTHQESHGSETTRSETCPYEFESHVSETTHLGTRPYVLESDVSETTPLETRPYVLESLASMTMFAQAYSHHEQTGEADVFGQNSATKKPRTRHRPLRLAITSSASAELEMFSSPILQEQGGSFHIPRSVSLASRDGSIVVDSEEDHDEREREERHGDEEHDGNSSEHATISHRRCSRISDRGATSFNITRARYHRHSRDPN